MTRDARSDLCTDKVVHKYPVARPDGRTDGRTDAVTDKGDSISASSQIKILSQV